MKSNKNIISAKHQLQDEKRKLVREQNEKRRVEKDKFKQKAEEEQAELKILVASRKAENDKKKLSNKKVDMKKQVKNSKREQVSSQKLTEQNAESETRVWNVFKEQAPIIRATAEDLNEKEIQKKRREQRIIASKASLEAIIKEIQEDNEAKRLKGREKEAELAEQETQRLQEQEKNIKALLGNLNKEEFEDIVEEASKAVKIDNEEEKLEEQREKEVRLAEQETQRLQEKNIKALLNGLDKKRRKEQRDNEAKRLKARRKAIEEDNEAKRLKEREKKAELEEQEKNIEPFRDDLYKKLLDLDNKELLEDNTEKDQNEIEKKAGPDKTLSKTVYINDLKEKFPNSYLKTLNSFIIAGLTALQSVNLISINLIMETIKECCSKYINYMKKNLLIADETIDKTTKSNTPTPTFSKQKTDWSKNIDKATERGASV